MELLKRNVHMDRMDYSTEMQFSLEEDRNIPDAKPDVSRVIYADHEIRIDEVRGMADQTSVRGKLLYRILYASEEEQMPQLLVGEIPFEEQVHMPGITVADRPMVDTKVLDFSVHLINSRKCNLQSVVGLHLFVPRLYAEEAVIGVQDDDKLEFSQKHLDILQTTIQKKDLFRVREELTIPKDFPNIATILYSSIRSGKLSFSPMEEKIGVQGELFCFIVYETMEENQIRVFQTVLPFNGVLECQGCKEGGILYVTPRENHKEIEIHSDDDGEDRIFGVEYALDLDIVMYQPEKLELLADVYGVTKQVTTTERETNFRTLLAHTTGRQKLSGRVRLDAQQGIIRILRLDGQILCDTKEVREQGVGVTGNVELTVLYQNGGVAPGWASETLNIPFDYTCEAAGILGDADYRVNCRLENLEANMLDSEEAEVSATAVFELLAFENVTVPVITEITKTEMDPAVLDALPGMVIYVVKRGDSLWKIGKRYYIPISLIKEINNLSGDEIYPGQKLLLLKHIAV